MTDGMGGKHFRGDFIEDDLDDLGAELITDHDSFVHDLFSRPSGQWYRLRDLVGGLTGIPDYLAGLETDAHGPVMVAWMDYLPPDNREGFRTVTYFIEPLVWSYTGVVDMRTIEA